MPIFLPPVNYGSGSTARAVTVADLNHDGHADVVVASVNGVGVLLGNGDGTLKTVITYGSGGLFTRDVAVADLNHDGKLDIVALSDYGSGGNGPPVIGVLLGNGDGTFQPAVTYDPSPGASGPMAIALADLDGDGKLDIVVSNCNFPASGGCASAPGGVAVLLGNGDGTFQPAVSYGSGGYGAAGVTVADLNGDHKMDIIVVNQCPQYCAYKAEGTVGVLLGNGDGTFQPAISYDPNEWSSNLVVAADVNGDGKPDLLVSGCRGSDGQTGCNWSTVSVLLGVGDGTFQSSVPYYVVYGGFTGAMAVADINQDGRVDVVEPGEILLGNGDGTFQPALAKEAVGNSGIAILDMNGDGRPDFVGADRCDNCSTAGVDVQLHVGDTVTTTALTSTPNPSVFGQVIFTATVASGSGTPTGTIILYDESYGGAIATGTLAGGSVTIPGAYVMVGTEPVVAAYQGSLQDHPSLSPVVEQVVSKATTTTATTSSSNPGVVGKVVDYTVTVTSQYGGDAGGGVTCLDNGAKLGLAKGQFRVFKAKYTVSGTHSIVCSYAGDGNTYPSTAPTLTEIVLDPTTTVLATSGSPSHVGQSVTFTATVTSKYGSIPNGDLVAFTAGATTLCSTPVSSGTATCSTSFSKEKTYSIKAQYDGDTTFAASFGKVTQVVEP